jgi:hypothetical protein
VLVQLDSDCAAAKELQEQCLLQAYSAAADFVRKRVSIVQMWLLGTTGDLPDSFAPAAVVPGGGAVADNKFENMMEVWLAHGVVEGFARVIPLMIDWLVGSACGADTIVLPMPVCSR